MQDPAPRPLSDTERVREKAKALGFEAVGVARADVPLGVEYERYERFVAAGWFGEMDWLKEPVGVRQRLDTAAILEGARSVVCVARRYQRSAESEAHDPDVARTIARYARGRDYHNGVRKKLRQLARFMRTLGGDARPMCDDAPLLERAWAARAGLGFVGKNGMLIVPGEGSFVLLGEVVTTLALSADTPMPERCGSCTRCLDACPTGAFVEPFVLDARRCISYLTIEKRSATVGALREAIGERLFGCDDCQSVCPFNGSARERDPARTRAFEPHPRWGDLSLQALLEPSRWVELTEGSPLRRATADGLARNAVVVLGNRRSEDARGALARALVVHPSPMVREACRWALARLDERRPGHG
ncbi:MAG: tRNA epoxyqueuosine(34) reductase QueG [Myxococcales bacterium]|nr:tRNA epoxyqueuosine(34) reductase QueG [Myxococcales bacterium]